jgi:hypothetical protein
MQFFDLPLGFNRILYCLYYLNDREYCKDIGFTLTWVWYVADLWNSVESAHLTKITQWYYAIDKQLTDHGVDSNIVFCILVGLLVATVLVVLVKLLKYLWSLVETVVIAFAKLCVIALISLAVNIAWDFYTKSSVKPQDWGSRYDGGEWD